MKKLNKKWLAVAAVLLCLVIPFLWRKDVKAPDLTTNQSSGGEQIDSSQEVQQPDFDKVMYSLSDPASPWVIVNKQRPLSPKDYAPGDLTMAGGGQQLREEAANALIRLTADAKANGLTISARSGYRSYARQQVVYQNEVKANGQAVADTQSAKPGYSEHQTGWAIDVGGGGCDIEDCFGNTKQGQWVAANAHRFGYIIRYPKGKDAITGYRYEPWHIRYVGTELATELKNQGITTLEEFFDL